METKKFEHPFKADQVLWMDWGDNRKSEDITFCQIVKVTKHNIFCRGIVNKNGSPAKNCFINETIFRKNIKKTTDKYYVCGGMTVWTK